MITYGRASQDDGPAFRSSGSGIECTPRSSVHFEEGLKDFQEQHKSMHRRKNRGESAGVDRSRLRRAGPANLVETGSLSDELGSSHVDTKMAGLLTCPMPSASSNPSGGTDTQDSKSGKISVAQDLSPLESTLNETPEHVSNEIISDYVLPSTTCSKSLCEVEIPLSHTQQSSQSRKPPSEQMNESDGSVLEQNEPVSTGSPISPKISIRLEQDNVLPSLAENRNDNEHDELSVLVSIPPRGNTKAKIPNSKKAQQENGHPRSDGFGSDEIALGLPVEQYNPRPSRSRSGQTNGDLLIPADFFVKPETLVKRKKNRRKTTAFERPLHDSEEERDVAQFRDPIVLIKPRSEAAVKLQELENILIFKAPIDPLPQLQDAENVSKTLRSKKTGRPKKIVQDHKEESDPPADKTENLSKVAPLRSDIVSSPTKPLSKKRKAPPDTSAFNDSDSEPSQFSNEDVESNPDSCKRNTIPAKTQVPSTLRLPSPSTTQSISSSSKLSIPPPPQTPQKEVKGPDKHSPLNTGKLSHRVGLSKRARIEPLLKIVRK